MHVRVITIINYRGQQISTTATCCLRQLHTPKLDTTKLSSWSTNTSLRSCASSLECLSHLSDHVDRICVQWAPELRQHWRQWSPHFVLQWIIATCLFCMICWHNLHVDLLIRIFQDIFLERIVPFLMMHFARCNHDSSKSIFFLILRDLMISPEDLTTTTVPRMTQMMISRLMSIFSWRIRKHFTYYSTKNAREQHEHSDSRRGQFSETLRNIEKTITP